MNPTHRRLRRLGPPAAALVLAAVAACGDDTPDDQLTGVAREGREVAGNNGCTNCHSANGDEMTGPSWKGIWGTTEELEDGREVQVDAAYVERSIRDPQADVVAGFNVPMPPFELTDEEVDAVVAYIESLGTDDGAGSP